MLDDYLKANLASWDEAVGLHVGSQMYNVEGFKKGRCSLSDIELSELGPSVHEGTTLLHLQCHFGLDTLSWARRGAVVTGVDFSGEGVGAARALADEVGLSARAAFVQSDVLALPDVLQGRFDVVFTSWGALIWLGDLERWAQVIAHFLKPGWPGLPGRTRAVSLKVDPTGTEVLSARSVTACRTTTAALAVVPSATASPPHSATSRALLVQPSRRWLNAAPPRPSGAVTTVAILTFSPVPAHSL